MRTEFRAANKICAKNMTFVQMCTPFTHMLESEEYLQLGLIGPKVICQTNAPLTRHLLKVGLARGLLAGSQMVLLCQTLTLTPAESKAFSVDSFFSD